MATFVALSSFAAAVLAAAAIAATGCASLSALLEEPKVGLQALKVQDPTANGVTLVFLLLVENPNPIALGVDELAYDLEVSGRALTSGKLAGGARIPPKGEAVVEIPVPVKYSDLFTSVLQLLKDQASPYRLKGAARVGPFEIPFDRSGELKLPKGGSAP